MPIILNGTTGITTPGITNTGPFTFQGVVELPAGAVGAPSLTTTGDTNTGIYFPAANQVAIATDGAQRVLVDATGNVGVGVTPSAWQTGSNVYGIDIGPRAALSNSNTRTTLWNNAYRGAGGSSIYKQNGEASQYDQDGGVHSWYTAPSGTAGNTITFTQVLAVEKAKSLALEGATTQSGTGITFPATQSASSNANTLDDYEEGTFTATLVGTSSNPTVTYSYQTGKYTKVGDIVYINLFISPSAYSGGSGNLDITGLPFTSAGGSTAAPILSGWTSGINWPAGYTQFAPLVIYGDTRIWTTVVGDEVGYGRLSVSDVTAGDEIRISGWYYV